MNSTSRLQHQRPDERSKFTKILHRHVKDKLYGLKEKTERKAPKKKSQVAPISQVSAAFITSTQ